LFFGHAARYSTHRPEARDKQPENRPAKFAGRFSDQGRKGPFSG